MFTVNYRKHFVNGNLVGMVFDTRMRFVNREALDNFLTFLKDHSTKPVDAIGGSDYTCELISVFKN